MDKRSIITAVIAQLKGLLATLEASARSARENATSDESRAENEYDTRALEAGYLAGAQAARAEQIQGEITLLEDLKLRAWKRKEPIEAGALIDLEDEDGKTAVYFLSPTRGLTVIVGGKEVRVLAPSSPLGTELLGKQAGDEVEVEVRGEPRGYTIRNVR